MPSYPMMNSKVIKQRIFFAMCFSAHCKVMAESGTHCQYMFKRGELEGQVCPIKKTMGADIPYCKKHYNLLEKTKKKGSTGEMKDQPNSTPPSPQAQTPPKMVYIPPEREEIDPDCEVIVLDKPQKPMKKPKKPKKREVKVEEEIEEECDDEGIPE